MPKFKIFRLAFVCATDKLQKISFDYFKQLISVLPTDVPDEKVVEIGVRVIPPLKPNKEQFDKLKEIADKYQQVCSDAYCYINDLRVEAQKELLGNIFDNDVLCREPLSEEFKVISTDDAKLKELEKYFYENTEKGKEWIEFTKDRKL
jgi:hypothetical protein